jgi:3-hydroxybutyryl-CoA dehydrogenase
VKTIGVIGAGTMGAGIAYAAAASGFDVLLQDVSDTAVERGITTIQNDCRKGVEKGKLSAEQSASLLAKIRTTSSTADLGFCDIVIEAAIENIDVKRSIFSGLESICPPDTILATNTSSLSVTAIASSMKRPDRFVGMHFFNPAHIMKLVEIIQGHATSDTTVSRTRQLAVDMGKVPVLAKDTPGFIVNRVARPFYGEALRILGEGIASIEAIDRIVTLEGGFKMGPFELMDLIGIDINFAVTKSMYEQTFGEARYRPHVIQQRMVHAGTLGRKTKRGFYTYNL